jgi:hypothetical protein
MEAALNYFYDYHFSTPAENAVNKRIIDRCFFVVCQRDNHNYF